MVKLSVTKLVIWWEQMWDNWWDLMMENAKVDSMVEATEWGKDNLMVVEIWLATS